MSKSGLMAIDQIALSGGYFRLFHFMWPYLPHQICAQLKQGGNGQYARAGQEEERDLVKS